MTVDLTAPTDPVMADSVAALAVVRAGFVDAHAAVGCWAAGFAAEIEQILVGLPAAAELAARPRDDGAA